MCVGSISNRLTSSAEEHKAILEALNDKEYAKAKDLLRKHFDGVTQNILDEIKQLDMERLTLIGAGKMAETVMTPYQRVMTALDGRKPDRVPVVPIVREWCVRQAGFEFAEVMGASKNMSTRNITACGVSAMTRYGIWRLFTQNRKPWEVCSRYPRICLLRCWSMSLKITIETWLDFAFLTRKKMAVCL